MYLLLFFTVIVIFIAAIQNSMQLDLNFLYWNFQMSLAVLVLISSLLGGFIIALITIPKLIKKHFNGKKIAKEIYALKAQIDKLRRQNKCEDNVFSKI